jgi:hypothetical protein
MSERDGYLLGYGPMPWNEARTLLDGFQAVWADLDGWHVDAGSLPSDQPVATHLWAWKTDEECWARVRFDGDSAIVGILAGTGVDLPTTAGSDAQPVEYKVFTGVPWGDDRQIPPQGDSIRSLSFEIVSITGVESIEFVRVRTD